MRPTHVRHAGTMLLEDCSLPEAVPRERPRWGQLRTFDSPAEGTAFGKSAAPASSTFFLSGRPLSSSERNKDWEAHGSFQRPQNKVLSGSCRTHKVKRTTNTQFKSHASRMELLLYGFPTDDLGRVATSSMVALPRHSGFDEHTLALLKQQEFGRNRTRRGRAARVRRAVRRRGCKCSFNPMLIGASLREGCSDDG